MKHRYALFFAGLLIGGILAFACGVDEVTEPEYEVRRAGIQAQLDQLESDLQALQTIVAGHRTHSQEWGEELNDYIYDLVICVLDPNPDVCELQWPDPPLPPPPDSDW